ncbi:MAG: hypothetical protein IOC66_33835 [Burkholderia sp.]|nr:hypothetical protein [Burkholderia sp.]
MSLLVTGVCTDAYAQAGPQQTVEGAQEFLSKVLPGASVFRDNGAKNDSYGKITSVTYVERCKTSVAMSLEENADFYASSPTVVFDWSSPITAAKESPDKIWLSRPSQKRYKFTFTGSAITDRIEYAMNFLRTNCDAAANTGF